MINDTLNNNSSHLRVGGWGWGLSKLLGSFGGAPKFCLEEKKKSGGGQAGVFASQHSAASLLPAQYLVINIIQYKCCYLPSC